MTAARYRPAWDLTLDPLLSCKLCLGEFPPEEMTTLSQCQCIFCTQCLKQYVELLIRDGLEPNVSCPDSACPKQGRLQEDEIECMVAAESLQRYKRLQFEREVLLDPCRTWCPSSSCQAVCRLPEAEPPGSQPARCPLCRLDFCSLCRAAWHPGRACRDLLLLTSFLLVLPGVSGLSGRESESASSPASFPSFLLSSPPFCWFCLESLDDDFLLIHYDKGPCRNKLGHSRASVIWHRTQVVGIFAGFGLLLLVASPLLLLATPFVLCCKCKCSKRDDDPLPT
uniref:E3 ubiquitin-protein ligase RNF144A-like n=1 Tax=Centroberyx gerrardi TaxID=166262 RepID=UPI003AACD0B5